MVKSIYEIKQAIEQLTHADRQALFAWQEQHFDDVWDRQMREDSESGRLDFLIDQAIAEDEAGETKSL